MNDLLCLVKYLFTLIFFLSLRVMLFTSTEELWVITLIFSEALKRYRQEVVQLSQVEVAKRLNISKQLFNSYENGKYQFPNDILRKLVTLYQMSPEDLFRIISDAPYPSDQRDSTMVLREKFEEGEWERAIDILRKYPQLKNIIITASYYNPRQQEKYINKLVTLFKTLEE
ncbi:helix-turn-helix transcriptional regulator [Bacillus salacetis]|uniref:helix-turn-helix transcriptional regulator n=1 Tax=Bacillus salacetis TaxID=2315464 RepID=UPI003BA3DDF8